MKIHVTQEDIDAGEQRCGQSCAIARAVQRVVKPGTRVEVLSQCLLLEAMTVDWGTVRPQIRDFIADFDINRKTVVPFEFDLEIPFQFQRSDHEPQKPALIADPALLLAVA